MNDKERLLSLFSPELWPLLDQMSDVQLRHFACDCAEHILPFFERLMPDDKRPRTAIETARRFAKGEADAAALKNASEDAEGAAWKAGDVAYARSDNDTKISNEDDAAASAAAGAEGCCLSDAKIAASAAAANAIEVVLIAGLGGQEADRVWAWQSHFSIYSPEKLEDPAELAAKVGQERMDKYNQTAKPEQDWQITRARTYLEGKRD